MSSAPCDAGFLSQVFSGNAIVCNSSFQQYETDSGVAQIQSVIDNADTFYSGTAADAVANTVGSQQETQVSEDVANVTDSISNSSAGKTCSDGSPGIDLTFLGGPCIKFLWLEIGGGIIIALIILYFLAIFSSVIPKR